MKKQLLVITLIMVIFACCIYGILLKARGGQGYFNAVVLETDNELVVKVLHNENISVPEELVNAEKIVLGDVMANKELELKVGDAIRVTYNTSSITYEPLKINVVFDIYMLEELMDFGMDNTSDISIAAVQ